MTSTMVAPSIFAADSDGFFTAYAARLHIREKLIGGIPKNPKVIEGWLRSKAGVTVEEEVRMMMARTLVELGAEVDPGETDMEKLLAASESLASAKQTNGFKTNGQGLYIEGRQIKALLKESINALFAGEEKWGKTKKGPKNFAAEHVFVKEERVYLGTEEPSGIEMVIGHITGPGGPRATVGYVEYVLQPQVEFTVLCDPVAESAIGSDHWRKIWLHAQENGLGAMRSQGHGRFNVVSWQKK